MSVLESERKPTTLRAIEETEMLCNYTLLLSQKEEIFPKRYRWCFTSELINDMYEACTDLQMANKIIITGSDSYKKRTGLQDSALRHIVRCKVIMQQAAWILDPKTSKIMHYLGVWSRKYESSLCLIRQWNRSDVSWWFTVTKEYNAAKALMKQNNQPIERLDVFLHKRFDRIQKELKERQQYKNETEVLHI